MDKDLTLRLRSSVRQKVVNDAEMQALASYKGGKLLFLGIGTGLSRFCHDRRRHRRTHGAWPSVLQKTYLRRLCRHPRIRLARQKEIAEEGRGRCSPPRCRFGTRGRRFGRRRRQKLKELPPGRRAGDERQRIRGRVSPLEESGQAEDSIPAKTRSPSPQEITWEVACSRSLQQDSSSFRATLDHSPG